MISEPEERRQEGVELQNPLFRLTMASLARLAAWVLFILLGPVRVFGKGNVPRRGGLLILANHRSDVDPALAEIACPRAVYFMAKSELFGIPVLGWFLRCFRAFPVKRGEPDRNSIKKAVAYLQAGEAVCIFPEGELSETGEMLPLKPGIALIVRMANVPVICLGLSGTARVLPYGKLIPRPAFGWVTARWGEPRQFGESATKDEILDWADCELRRLEHPGKITGSEGNGDPGRAS